MDKMDKGLFGFWFHFWTEIVINGYLFLRAAIYSGLPQEVTQIGHLIGLEKGALQRSEQILKEFVTDRADKKQDSDDFKYKVYNLFIRLIYIFYILKEVQKNGRKRNW